MYAAPATPHNPPSQHQMVPPSPQQPNTPYSTHHQPASCQPPTPYSNPQSNQSHHVADIKTDPVKQEQPEPKVKKLHTIDIKAKYKQVFEDFISVKSSVFSFDANDKEKRLKGFTYSNVKIYRAGKIRNKNEKIELIKNLFVVATELLYSLDVAKLNAVPDVVELLVSTVKGIKEHENDEIFCYGGFKFCVAIINERLRKDMGKYFENRSLKELQYAMKYHRVIIRCSFERILKLIDTMDYRDIREMVKDGLGVLSMLVRISELLGENIEETNLLVEMLEKTFDREINILPAYQTLAAVRYEIGVKSDIPEVSKKLKNLLLKS